MTGGADLFDLNQKRVTIAIKSDLLHVLSMSAGLAFHPKFLARAAPEMGLAGFDGLFQGSAIHPGHHQHLPGRVILDDGRNQTVAREF